MKAKLKYLIEDSSRHGQLRYYVRRPGMKKIRIRGEFGSPEFMKAYADAMAERPEQQLSNAPESLNWLIRRYFASSSFQELRLSTQRARRNILERFCEEHGDKPYALLGGPHVVSFRDQRAKTPHAANNLLKALMAPFDMAVELQLVKTNPVRAVRKVRTKSTGFHTWSIEEVRRYERVHPVGSAARLALALFLFTGQRRSDVCLLGPKNEEDETLTFAQQKTGKVLTVPILPNLRAVIEASVIGLESYLVTSHGNPFSPAGLGNKMREWCDQAKLPHCSAHGLRKAGATIAAENGATAFELMAIFGFSLSIAETYVRAVDQARMAAQAMNKIVPPSSSKVSHPEKDC